MGPPQSTSRRKTLLRNLLILALIGGAAAGFVSFGPPGLYAKAATPEFCAGCHVMESEFESWFHNGGHRGQQCVACHLPNDNPVKHAAWKGLTGMQDVFAFYSGRVPETIKISPSGAAIVLDNCKRCHAEMVSRLSEDRQCWDCHRRLSHRNTGAM